MNEKMDKKEVIGENLKIGVALGGGGMCGVAHVGFMQQLLESGIKVDAISGISMGAIVGGLYASGMNFDEMEKVAKALSKKDIIELNYFKILKEGLISSKKIERFLKKNVKTENIENGKIEFYAGACDLLTGKLHFFDKGSFVTALRASSAIPAIFPPVYANNTCYVDGGTCENVPFNILKEKGVDVIIAVDCLSEYSKDRLPNGSFSTLVYAMDVMQRQLIDQNKRHNKKNFDIYCYDITEGVYHTDTNFKVIPKLIENGRECAKEYIKKIKKIIEKKESLKKRLINQKDCDMIKC